MTDEELEAWREIGRAVLKLGYNLPMDDLGRHYCPWCHWNDEGDLATHERNCPFTRIHALLDNHGHGATPTNE